MANDLETLPLMIDRAMVALDGAKTAGEILDAREQATFVYDTAKSAARLLKAKGAHATVLAACHQLQADALTIEARAQTRLADEYEAAQERGEVARRSDGAAIRDHVPGENKVATVADIGLTRKQIHEARAVRDAEKRAPGIVKKTLAAKLEAGEEPTRADVKRAVKLNDAPQTNGHTQAAKGKAEPKREPDTISSLRTKLTESNRVNKQNREISQRLTEDNWALRIERDYLRATRIHDTDEHVRLRVVAEGKEYLAMVKEREVKVQKDEKWWEELTNNHKPLFTADQFKAILMCLHPDGQRTTDKLAEAFRLFNSKRLQLTGAKS
jgi:hypothetical protein